MRISDWSSDVCSSDLGAERPNTTIALAQILQRVLKIEVAGIGCGGEAEGFARAHAVGEGNEGDSDGQSERGVLGDQSLETGRHVIELGARDADRKSTRLNYSH